jgi:hypothetical protein
MSPKLFSEPVGILVGQIIDTGRPLMIWLHLAPDGTHHTRVYEDEDPMTDAFGSAISLAASLSPQVYRFWTNETHPSWYYIQLREDYPPQRLNTFDLPWSVYENWRRSRRQ